MFEHKEQEWGLSLKVIWYQEEGARLMLTIVRLLGMEFLLTNAMLQGDRLWWVWLESD
jgi:hypothetical protein